MSIIFLFLNFVQQVVFSQKQRMQDMIFEISLKWSTCYCVVRIRGFLMIGACWDFLLSLDSSVLNDLSVPSSTVFYNFPLFL